MTGLRFTSWRGKKEAVRTCTKFYSTPFNSWTVKDMLKMLSVAVTTGYVGSLGCTLGRITIFCWPLWSPGIPSFAIHPFSPPVRSSSFWRSSSYRSVCRWRLRSSDRCSAVRWACPSSSPYTSSMANPSRFSSRSRYAWCVNRPRSFRLSTRASRPVSLGAMSSSVSRYLRLFC